MRKEKRAALIRQQDLEDIEILTGYFEENSNEIVALRQGGDTIEISAWLLREVAERLRSQANFMEPVVVRGRGEHAKDIPHSFGRTRVGFS